MTKNKNLYVKPQRSLPTNSVGFCWRCNKAVEFGTGWYTKPVNVGTPSHPKYVSQLFHGGDCPTRKADDF